MASKTAIIVVNIQFAEGDSLKKLHRSVIEELRVNEASDFNPAEAGSSGVPPNPQPLLASRLPEIDARLTQLATTLANAEAAGNSRGNQDLQERCREDIISARADYTFETKR